jgi:outer membrane protein OmpA-like peptidoglycan-associated protein
VGLRLISLAGALALAGCQTAAPDLVVVLPSADGHTGAVVVERGGERTVLDRSYAASRTGDKAPTQLDAKQVRDTFGPALEAMPPRPASFLLYFVTGTDELTAVSKGQLGRMLQELKRRPASDILVIGHTDRVGQQAENDRLSLMRAQRLKADLVGQGIPAGRIHAAGRGEREPLVPTDDGIDEPRNRRVEINVR